MREIVALLQSITPVISTTTLRQLSQVVYGMLISNGRITMLELSRWTEKGGSYRTIQRLYHTPILWLQIQWVFFTSQFHQLDREYIAAGDEVVFGKAGKETHGLGRFFSSLQNRVIPGLSLFVFSLMDVQERQSYPIQAVQIIKEPKQPKKKEKEKPSQAKKCPVGRPKGSKNKKKEPPILSPELLRIQPILQAFLAVLKGILTVRYLVMDGHFGNHPSAWMVLQTGLQLVSKFRSDAALYEPFTGKYCGHGPHPTYDDKVDVRRMKKKYLKSDETEAGIRTQIYQATLLNREFAAPINVVVILKTNLSSKKQAHVILFSTDLELSYEKLYDYYTLRFQIEKSFRDDKSGGFDMEHTRLQHIDRIDRLFLAIATLWCHELGEFVLKQGDTCRSQVDPAHKRTLSLSQLGLRWLKRVLATGLHSLPNFHAILSNLKLKPVMIPLPQSPVL